MELDERNNARDTLIQVDANHTVHVITAAGAEDRLRTPGGRVHDHPVGGVGDGADRRSPGAPGGSRSGCATCSVGQARIRSGEEKQAGPTSFPQEDVGPARIR